MAGFFIRDFFRIDSRTITRPSKRAQNLPEVAQNSPEITQKSAVKGENYRNAFSFYVRYRSFLVRPFPSFKIKVFN